MYRINDRLAEWLLRFLNEFRRFYHRAEIRFAERLPASGGALIVSNHGRMDVEYLLLAGMVCRSSGRVARIMVHHIWYRYPIIPRILALVGAVRGTRENAVRHLSAGEMVLTYPGGVTEILSSRHGHEHIDWQNRTGFAHVAIATGVPVIPIVGVGVNDGLHFLTSGRLFGKFWFQKILRIGPAHAEHRDPLAIGLLPIPLPFSIAIHFPLPVKVRYFVGEPIYPVSAEGTPEDEDSFAQHVEDAMRALIEEYGRPQTDVSPACRIANLTLPATQR